MFFAVLGDYLLEQGNLYLLVQPAEILIVAGSEHYRDDYFVHYLLVVEPPDWNKVSLPAEPAPSTGN